MAAAVGERFSYEQDDIATLKVFATILLLPLLYILAAVVVGMNFGSWWALAALLVLPLSFFFSVRLIEAEVSLFVSLLSLLRLTRLGSEVHELRQIRMALVSQVRDFVEQHTDPDLPRIFYPGDFKGTGRK